MAEYIDREKLLMGIEALPCVSNKIRRIFQPTPEEELEDIGKIAEIRKSLKGTCSACIHHEETDLPGYFTDYGRCRVESPLFGDIVTNPLVKCPSYQDREQTSGPTVKCRYVYGDNICEKYSGNGEIIYCVEGPCPYMFEEMRDDGKSKLD